MSSTTRQYVSLKNKTVISLFEEQVLINPDAIAVVYQQEQVTYQKLNDRCNQVAHYLLKKGLKTGDLVPVCIERGIELLVAIIGVLKAGGAYVPIDPEYPADRINYMLSDTGAVIVLSSSKSLKKLAVANAGTVIELDTDKHHVSSEPTGNLPQTAAPDQLAYVIYTSGSTGKPKGVMIEHQNTYSFIQWCHTEFEASDFDVFYAATSVCFDLSVFELFYPLTTGKRIRLLDNGLSIKNHLQQDANIFINTVPSVIKALLQEQADLGNVNIINMAGEPVPEQVLNGLDTARIEVRNLYGPTEDTTYSTVYKLKQGEPILIGKPITGTVIYLLDEQKHKVSAGVVGEMYIGGEGVARGYLNQPQLTAERFLPDTFSKNTGARMYRTGDLGRFLPDGNIEFLGRTDDQVKIRGYRIELGEIESVLNKSGLVEQAVVLGKEDTGGDKRLVSYYIPNLKKVKQKEQELYRQQVAAWTEVYDTEYRHTAEDPSIDPEFNILGWNDSFTGLPLGDRQMREWLDDIIAVIDPETAGSVLEIGCGTGMIFYKLAGKVEQYFGTDISQFSIDQIRSRINTGVRDYGPAEFWVSPAHEISLKPGIGINTIVMNSVAQYFPGQGYMSEVLAKCLDLLQGPGRIIIGDVRDLRTLGFFKGRLQLQKLADTDTAKDLAWVAEQENLKEEELCFLPEYFYNLKTIHPQISHVDIQWKQISSENEMSLYRYNVVLHVGTHQPGIQPQWQQWAGLNKQNITRQLKEGVSSIAIQDAPNPKLWKEKLLSQAIEKNPGSNLKEVKQFLEKKDDETKHITNLLDVARSNGYHSSLLLNEDVFKTNILLYKSLNPHYIHNIYSDNKPEYKDRYTNVPLFTEISSILKKDIRYFLQQHLPEYMVPQEYIAVKQFPLNNNGKTDLRFLASSDALFSRSKKNYVPASTVTEHKLVNIWEDLLDAEHIGIQDDFFELGGNSLIGMRLVSVINKELGLHISIKDLLTYPTIIDLSTYLQDGDLKVSQLLIPIKASGSKTPLFIVCGSGGTIFTFMEFASMLDPEQPVYGLQQPNHEHASESFPDTIEGIAAKYIEQIRSEYPVGPYALSGHCLGGTIAFEMAKQLVASGEAVSSLLLFDTIVTDKQIQLLPSHINKNRFKSIVKNYLSKAFLKIKFETFLLLKHPKQSFNYKINKLRSLIKKKEPKVDDLYLKVFNSMSAVYENASDNYLVTPYHGDIVVFYAKEQYYFMDRLENVIYNKFSYSNETKNAWNQFATSVTIHEVDGEHSEIFEPEKAAELAKLSQQHLNDSSASK